MNTEASNGALSKLLGSGNDNSKDFNFREVYSLIIAGRWTLVVTTLAFILVALLYILVTPPTFEADGLVQVEEDSRSGGSSQLNDLSSLLLGTPVQTEAEIQILQSHMVLDQVIDKLNLLVSAKPRRFPLFGNAIARHRKSETSLKPVSGWIGSYCWAGESIKVTTFTVPLELEESTFTVVATDRGYDLFDPHGTKLLSGVVGELETADSSAGPVSIFVRVLNGAPGKTFEIVRNGRSAIQDSLGYGIKVVEQGKQSGVIKISIDGPNPAFVSAAINGIEEAYLRQNVERHSADAEQSLEFLEKQLPSMKEKLDTAEAQLKEYQQAHGSIDVTQETAIALTRSVDLESQELQLQQQRDVMVQRFMPDHPAVRALDRQLDQIKLALDKQKEASQKLPATQQEILGLLRDVDVNSGLYTEMMNSIQQLQVAKAGTIGNVRVVDFALAPKYPIKPKPVLILIIAVASGLSFSVFFIVMQRALIRGVDNPTEIEQRFGLPTYAMVPFANAQRRLHDRMRKGKEGNYILASLENSNVAVEALRSLRTSLHFALFEAKNNLVVFTGPAPGLGKSFVSVNLSAVLAFSGKKVLLIDCDLRKGHLHEYISAEISPGVVDFVAGDSTLRDIVRKTPVAGFDMITRGIVPPNPSELLLHKRFVELLETASREYDYVMIDTPPVLAVTDAAIVSKLAGSTLIVLKSAAHPLPQIEETVKRLAAAGANLKGTVFNLVGERAGSYGYGGYGYAYYNYGEK